MKLNPSLKDLFEILLSYWGFQNWWPVDEEYHTKNGTDKRDEIVIGAVLTQNTSWKNVESALRNLKSFGELSLDFIRKVDLQTLKEIIKPAGFFNQKANTLKNLAIFLDPLDKLNSLNRKELLSLKGIGPETADAILLYAGNRLTFVVDKYTQRLVYRLYGIDGNYEKIKSLFEENLPKDLKVYKEFHALIDEHSKRFCKKEPLCEVCILKEVCNFKIKLIA